MHAPARLPESVAVHACTRLCCNNLPCWLSNTLCMRSAPIWFKSSTGLQRLFANGMQAVLKGFDYINGQLNPNPTAWEVNSQSILGGQPVISSDLGKNAVLWVCSRTALQAYDPTTAGQLTPIFSSANTNQAVIRANGGEANKGVVPTAVNGRVYLGYNHSVLVFGVLPTAG